MITVKMKHKKTTKGTEVYEAADTNAAIPTLYIKRDYMRSNTPKVIEVTFVEVEGE